MTPPDDEARLRHLRDAAERAIEFSTGKTRESLDEDEMLRLALTNYFDIDLDVLWSTVTDDLPTLLATVPQPEGRAESS